MAARMTLGVTGDVGSGKSAVMDWLARRGVAVLDADLVVHRLLDGDGDIVRAVMGRFGSRVAREGGGVDRAALAEIVFADADDLDDLEALVHPRVAARVAGWLGEQTAAVAAVEAVKLVESGLHRRLDVLWVVACDRAERRRRLAERGWSADQIAARLAASPPVGAKFALANAVIDNSGSRAATDAQLAQAWRRVEARLAAGVDA